MAILAPANLLVLALLCAIVGLGWSICRYAWPTPRASPHLAGALMAMSGFSLVLFHRELDDGTFATFALGAAPLCFLVLTWGCALVIEALVRLGSDATDRFVLAGSAAAVGVGAAYLVHLGFYLRATSLLRGFSLILGVWRDVETLTPPVALAFLLAAPRSARARAGLAAVVLLPALAAFWVLGTEWGDRTFMPPATTK